MNRILVLTARFCVVPCGLLLAADAPAAPAPAADRPTTFYVAPSNPAANDSTPGTAEAPWKTIAKAVQSARPGDTVIVKTGTYPGDIMVAAPHAGKPGRLITFKANPGDKVVIDGQHKNTFGFRLGASYIRIEGFEIVHVKAHGILAGWSDGSSLGVQIVGNSVHDCGDNPDTAAVYYAGGGGGLIENNHLFDNAGDGITFVGIQDGITIRNNNIHNNQVDGMKGGGAGTILIDHNTIHDMTNAKNHGDGMQLMGMTGTTVVRNNTVWNCTQDIYCDDYSEKPGTTPWGDVYISNNVVYNTDAKGTGGFYNGIVTGTRYNSWHSLTIANNTLVNLNDGSGGASVGVVGDSAGKIASVRVFNNLFYNSINGTAVKALQAKGGTVEMDRNLYFNQYRDWYLGEGWTTLGKFAAAHPDCEQHSFYTKDLKFIRDQFPDPDFHLAPNSPAIGKAAPIPDAGKVEFTTDHDGNPRPKDAWTIGAYEPAPEPSK